ncbi:MAG TPA: DedA family protein [Gemmatimonadaceae bacterium]|nr:DedA family protein [Gemmatimonadaceae bacterium]
MLTPVLALVLRLLSGAGASLSVYVTLGITSVFIEEAAPVVAGFAAHQGELRAVQAALACALGSWLADLGLFEIGRRHAVRIVKRWPRVHVPVKRLLRAVRRRPWHAALAVRFAYGARFLLPITCGASRMPARRFVVGSAISALTWSSLFTLLGWLFGHTALLTIGHLHHYEKRVALALAIGVLILVIVAQRRNAKNVAQEIAGREAAGEAADDAAGEAAPEP